MAGIIYGALVALAQSDLKRLIAYSSVSHLGFCMLGIFALNRVAVQGGTLQMINHGLSTGGLFALVGMLYERYHTRRIADFGGIAREIPVLAFFMVFMTLASIGLPGLNGFVGEFLLLMGMFQRAWGTAATAWTAQYRVISVLAVSGVVLGAWYMLSLVARVFFGPLRERKHAEPIADLSLREVLALVPLCLVIVWIGVQPKFFLDRMAPAVDQLAGAAMRAVDEQEGEKAGAMEGKLKIANCKLQITNWKASHVEPESDLGRVQEQLPSPVRGRGAGGEGRCDQITELFLDRSLGRVLQFSILNPFSPLLYHVSDSPTAEIARVPNVVCFLSAEIVLVVAALAIYLGRRLLHLAEDLGPDCLGRHRAGGRFAVVVRRK